MNQSIPTLTKPSQHYDISDWTTNIKNLSNVAHSKIDQAFSLRHGASSLRDKTDQKTIHNTSENNYQLSKRIEEVEDLREILDKSLADINKEIELLLDEKAKTENEVEKLDQLLHGLSNCTSTRDSRSSTELVYDPVDQELKREVCAAEFTKNALISQCQAMWIHLNQLKKIKLDLLNNIENKTMSISIDNKQLELNEDSKNISYKIGHNKNCMTNEQWIARTLAVEDECLREIRRSVAFRHGTFEAREKARNDMRERDDATEHELRRRIFDIRRAIDLLAWEKSKVEDSIEKSLVELSNLKDALFAKGKSLKLAESRLENRAHRPIEELVCDDVNEGLKREIQELNVNKRQLQDKIDMSKATYNDLEINAIQIVLDLEKKNKALEMDILCSKIRETFPTRTNKLIM